MLVPITVHVPDHLVPGFYAQFGRFVADEPASGQLPPPKRLGSGDYAPAWVDSEGATDLSRALWKELSIRGKSVLRYLTNATSDEPRHFTPEEIAEAIGHPKGQSVIAGILGGVGKAIRRAGLPMYTSRQGGAWHFVWDWDGTVYTMTPEVARLLRKASHHYA